MVCPLLFHGQGNKSDLITSHFLYQSLGRTDAVRQIAYRELFRHELELGEIDKIRKATNGNFSLGTNRFNEEISAMLGRRVTPGKAGILKKEVVVGKTK